MYWKIEFYSDKVEEQISEWPKHMKAKFLRVADLLEKMGPDELGMPHIKPLKAGLFEIRIKSDEGIGRAMFCTIKGRVIIILNGFIKKTQKAPPGEIELARRRMKEVKGND